MSSTARRQARPARRARSTPGATRTGRSWRTGRAAESVYGRPADEARADGPFGPERERNRGKLRVKTRSRIDGDGRVGGGRSVKVDSSEPAELALTLRSADFESEPGMGGSS